MKTIRCLTFLSLLLCTGCSELHLALLPTTEAPKKAAPVVEELAKPVAADDVTANNARKMAETLQKELEQADHGENYSK